MIFSIKNAPDELLNHVVQDLEGEEDSFEVSLKATISGGGTYPIETTLGAIREEINRRASMLRS